MDFTPPESAQAVAALAAEILGEPDPWKALARAGLLDVSSLGVLDLTILLTEIGRRAPSTRALATLLTGALPMARWGSDELKQQLLPGIASGELFLTAALREPSHPPARPPSHNNHKRNANRHQSRRPPRGPSTPSARACLFHDREQFGTNSAQNCSRSWCRPGEPPRRRESS